MNSNDFVQWLNGFLEACGSEPTPVQLGLIQQRLEEVRTFTAAAPIVLPAPAVQQPWNPMNPPFTYTGGIISTAKTYESDQLERPVQVTYLAQPASVN